MPHLHCPRPEQGQGQGNDGFQFLQCTVHTTQGQGQGTIVFYCANTSRGMTHNDHSLAKLTTAK